MKTVEKFKEVAGSEFTLRPDGTLGAADTAHHVFFGRLNGRDVAVKMHRTESDADHEARILKLVSATGITAVRPLRIMEGPGGRNAFLVTDRIPRLLSGASLPFQGTERQVASSAQSLEDISRTMAALHANGISHGDAQIKNFGLIPDDIDPRTGRPRVVVYDTEKGGADAYGHIKTEPFKHDLDSQAQSLAYKGFGGPDLDIAAAALEEHVLDPYLGHAVAMGMDPTQAADTVAHAYGAFLDQREQLAYAAHHAGRTPSPRRSPES